MQFLDPSAQQGSAEQTLPSSAGQLSPEQPIGPPAQDISPSGDKAVPDLLDVLLTLVVAFFSLVLCTTIVVAIAYAYPPFRHVPAKDLVRNALVAIPAQILGYVFVIVFMAFLIWTRHRSAFLPGISWNKPDSRLAMVALIGGAGMALGSEVLSALLQRWIPKSLPIEEYFKDPASGYTLALFGILVAPFVEEIFFRGFVYPALARWTGVATAVVITAAGFALLHGGQLANSWAPLTILFGVGAVLTIVRVRTGSVAVCVLMHMGYNLALFTIMFFGTQGFRHMERA